jgi:hypothetical protein
MQQLIGFVMLISMVAVPSAAIASEGDPPGLLRSGIAAVERMPDVSRRGGALSAQAQQSHLNHDKKTTIIVIAVVAVAAVIWINYELRHGWVWTSS